MDVTMSLIYRAIAGKNQLIDVNRVIDRKMYISPLE